MGSPDIKPTKLSRAQLTRIALAFAPYLDDPDLTEDQIIAFIEELRPLRMHFRALQDGEAPGYRDPEFLKSPK